MNGLVAVALVNGSSDVYKLHHFLKGSNENFYVHISKLL